MKLYYTPTSPFVRKVLVVAHETGQIDRIETTLLRPTPTKTDPTLSRDNPLSKIPALITEDVGALYDSAVICDYLDSRHAGRKLVAIEGAERWHALRRQALADGILEAGILVFYEKTLRPETLHWSPWLEGQAEKARQSLDALEKEAPQFGVDVDLGQISVAVALGWLDFRKVLGELRSGRPQLFAWYERFVARPSMQATLPHT